MTCRYYDGASLLFLMILVLVAGGSSAAPLPQAATQGHARPLGHSATDPRNREHWAATGGNSGVLVFGLQLSAPDKSQ